jgi:outer membrane protein assembly factor BamB
VAGGTVFVGGSPGVYGFDIDSGEQVWTVDGAEYGFESSPTVVDGTLFIGGNDGVYALETEVDASSEDSRVMLGTLGHHEGWTG